MKIAVVGCSHGELERIYYRTEELERESNTKIDLLICCGDFQATRNENDLRCMAVPMKYSRMGSFYKYYSGERIAPVLTLFIGGNHEASNYMQELPYGGWVAPNIYYFGYAGVVNFGGLRIGGLSGIHKPLDYMKGHFERAPYNESTRKSVYHVRNLEVFRLKQISNSLDIMLSHDWPREVYTYGDVDELIRNKPFFENEVNENKLGSKPCEELLSHLKPKNWFAAHLHTKFCAQVPHFSEDGTRLAETNFMALDKCLPRRNWIEVIDIPTTDDTRELTYDLEWLTILYLTDHLMSSKRTPQFMPGPSAGERWNFVPNEDEKEFIKTKMNNDLRIPQNFVRTAPYYNPYRKGYRNSFSSPCVVLNPQTVTLCEKIGIRDPLVGLMENFGRNDHYLSSPNGSSTPERPGRLDDTTFMSFNSSDVSERDGSFFSDRSSINSSFTADSSTCDDKSFKKPKLSLPPIEHTSLDAIDPDSNFPSLERSIPLSTNADVLSFCVDRSGSVSEIPSTNKRFKRRNASLYSSEDE